MAEAKKKVEATKPTPEEKQAAAEAEVDALVARAKKAVVEFENLDQKQVDRIVAKASIAALNKHLVLAKMARHQLLGRPEDRRHHPRRRRDGHR